MKFLFGFRIEDRGKISRTWEGVGRRLGRRCAYWDWDFGVRDEVEEGW